MRFELPAGLTEEEEQAILAALERYLAGAPAERNPWASAGRAVVRGPWSWFPDRRRSDSG